MDIKVEENNSTIIFELSGNLTFKDHMEFNTYMDQIKDSKKSVVFDVAKLEMIDSAGIGMLFLAQKLIEKRNRKIVIKNPRGQVKRIFDITSIGQQITVIEEE